MGLVTREQYVEKVITFIIFFSFPFNFALLLMLMKMLRCLRNVVAVVVMWVYTEG